MFLIVRGTDITSAREICSGAQISRGNTVHRLDCMNSVIVIVRFAGVRFGIYTMWLDSDLNK